MYLRRHLENLLSQAAKEFPSVAVIGARQTGKSTLLQHLFGRTHAYVTFDDLALRSAANRDPALFLSQYPGPVIFDEIQNVPELFPALKAEIDRSRRPGRFLLTGSQHFLLHRNLRETLAGRVLLLRLHGMTAYERAGRGETHWLPGVLSGESGKIPDGKPGPEFQPLRELRRGGLPGFLPVSEALLAPGFKSYVSTYLEKDLTQQHGAGDPAAMGDFLRLLAALTSQEINRSQLGRDMGISPPTSKRWLQWLSDANLWVELRPYLRNPVKRISKSPKGSLFDTGLICHLLQAQSGETLAAHPLLGAVFEAACLLELRAAADAFDPGSELYHWRTPYGQEADLVLEREGRLYAFECKWNSNPRPQDWRHLGIFREIYGKRVAFTGVITPIGTMRLLAPGVWQIPWAPVEE